MRGARAELRVYSLELRKPELFVEESLEDEDDTLFRGHTFVSSSPRAILTVAVQDHQQRLAATQHGPTCSTTSRH